MNTAFKIDNDEYFPPRVFFKFVLIPTTYINQSQAGSSSWPSVFTGANVALGDNSTLSISLYQIPRRYRLEREKR